MARGMEFDRHHILHHRQEWELRPEGKRLRQRTELVPVIPRQDHEHLHRLAPAVPVLPLGMLFLVNKLYRPQPDTMKAIDRLQMAIHEAGKHPKAHSVERQIGEVACEALDVQRLLLGEIL